MPTTAGGPILPPRLGSASPVYGRRPVGSAAARLPAADSPCWRTNRVCIGTPPQLVGVLPPPTHHRHHHQQEQQPPPAQQARGASVASSTCSVGASSAFSAASSAASTSLPRAYVRPRARGAREVAAAEAPRRSSSAHSFFADQLAAVSEERDSSVFYGMQLLRRLQHERRERAALHEEHAARSLAAQERVEDLATERGNMAARHADVHSKYKALVAERAYFVEAVQNRDEEIKDLTALVDGYKADEERRNRLLKEAAAAVAPSPVLRNVSATAAVRTGSPRRFSFYDGADIEREQVSQGVQAAPAKRYRASQTDLTGPVCAEGAGAGLVVRGFGGGDEEASCVCCQQQAAAGGAAASAFELICGECAPGAAGLREALEEERAKVQRLERRLEEELGAATPLNPLLGTPLSSFATSGGGLGMGQWGSASKLRRFSPVAVSYGADGVAAKRVSLEEELRLLDEHDGLLRDEGTARTAAAAEEAAALAQLVGARQAALTQLLTRRAAADREAGARGGVEEAEAAARRTLADDLRALNAAAARASGVARVLEEEALGRAGLEQLEEEGQVVLEGVLGSQHAVGEMWASLRMANRFTNKLCKEIRRRETVEVAFLARLLEANEEDEAGARAAVQDAEAALRAAAGEGFALGRRELQVGAAQERAKAAGSQASLQLAQRMTRKAIESQHRRHHDDMQRQREAAASLERAQGYSRTNVSMEEDGDWEQLRDLWREAAAAAATTTAAAAAAAPTTPHRASSPPPRIEAAEAAAAAAAASVPKQRDPQFVARMVRLGQKKAQQMDGAAAAAAEKGAQQQQQQRAVVRRPSMGRVATPASRRRLSVGGGSAAQRSTSAPAPAAARQAATRSVSVGTETADGAVSADMLLPEGRWASGSAVSALSAAPLSASRRSRSAHSYSDALSPAAALHAPPSAFRTPLTELRGRSYSTRAGSLTPGGGLSGGAKQTPVSHWAFDYDAGREWTQLREVVLHASASMALKIAQIKDSKDKEGIFKVAHQALKVVLSENIREKTFGPGEVWKLRPEEIECIPKHARSTVLRALRDIVCAYDMMRPTQKAALLTVQEIIINVPSLILLARWSQQTLMMSAEAAEKRSSTPPPLTPSHTRSRSARSTSPPPYFSIGRLSVYVPRSTHT